MKKIGMSTHLNKYSRIITQSKQNGSAQAMLYALGLNRDDLNKPQVSKI